MCFNPETDISPMRCDWCNKVCRTGDAFCSIKCAELDEAQSFLWAYTHGTPNTFHDIPSFWSGHALAAD